MNKIVLTSLLIGVISVFSFDTSASSSYWRDKVASERGYSDHTDMEEAYNKAKEEDRYWQQREEERQKEDDEQRERERTIWDNDNSD